METNDELLLRLGIAPNTVNYSVSIINDEEMRELNNQWRGKDKSTDVLSFPMLELVEANPKPTPENFPQDVNPETGKVELGDIVVNENEDNKDFLIQHGLLHLLGFHHEE